MTRLVPLVLVCALGANGCYLSHELGPRASSDGGIQDAPAAIDAFVPPPRPCALEPVATIQATSTAYSAHAPRIGWDGERLGLVVFESDGDIPHPVVSATRLSLDLSSSAPLAIAGEESHSWAEAAWDPRVGYAVCWNGDPGGPGRTLLRLRARDGAELAPRIDLDLEGGACEGLARAGDRWAVLWRHGTESVSMRVGLVDDRGVSTAAVDLDEPVAYPGRGAQIAGAPDAFVTAQARPDEGVAVARIELDGTISATTTVPAPLARAVALAAHDDGTIGLAVRDGPRESGGLRFVRLDRSLAPIGETMLVPLGRGVRHPRVAALPDGWAILWVEQPADATPATAAVLAHLDREGVPLEPRRTLVAGPNSGYGAPSLAAHDGSLYAAIAHDPGLGTGPEQAFVTRLACGERDRCAPLDARPSGDDCTTPVGWTWDGTGCAQVLCGCVGADCDRLAVTEEECLVDHAACARPLDR